MAHSWGVHEYRVNEFGGREKPHGKHHGIPWFVLYPLNSKEKHHPPLMCFCFLLLTTPRCAPPLVPPQKTAPRRMCGFWAFDRVKTVRGAGGTKGGTTLLFKARPVIPEAWTCAAKPAVEREGTGATEEGARNWARLVLSRKSIHSDRSELQGLLEKLQALLTTKNLQRLPYI